MLEMHMEYRNASTHGSFWCYDKLSSSPPSAAYMRHWTDYALVQIMACRLLGDKPLPEPMLAYSQLGSLEQSSVKFGSEYNYFHSRKWNCRLS